MRYALATVLLLLTAPCFAAQPADGWLLAWQDIQRVAPADQPYTRYLWFLEEEPKLRWTNYLAVSGLLNALSRNQRVVPPILILSDSTVRQWPTVQPEDWAKLTLVRVNVLDYWPDATVWDRLGDPNLEPFFHVTTVVPIWELKRDGYYYLTKEEKTTAIAPWLLQPLGLPQDGPVRDYHRKVYRDSVFGLIEATDYSPVPIVEVTNFVWQTAIQFDRKAGYYDFLGVRDRKTFQKLVGFDEKASLDFAYPQLEAISESGVAQQPRQTQFWRKIGGSYIFTLDQVNQRAQGNRNPLVIQKGFKHDAEEVFASLPNGFWATGLFAADGTRQDSAPDGVGYFHQSVSNDGKIHVNLACVVCHDRKPGRGGLQPFRPYFRTLYAAPGPIALADKDPKLLKVLEQQYLSPLNLDGDRRQYVEAVYQANGLAPHQYASYLYEVFHRYDSAVSVERAAVLFGVSQAELQRAFGTHLRFFGAIDNVSANFLLAEKRRMRIGIDQFAEFYNQGQLMLRGLPTWSMELRHWYPTRSQR